VPFFRRSCKSSHTPEKVEASPRATARFHCQCNTARNGAYDITVGAPLNAPLAARSSCKKDVNQTSRAKKKSHTHALFLLPKEHILSIVLATAHSTLTVQCRPWSPHHTNLVCRALNGSFLLLLHAALLLQCRNLVRRWIALSTHFIHRKRKMHLFFLGGSNPPLCVSIEFPSLQIRNEWLWVAGRCGVESTLQI
jgi:hypothetical protein